MEEKNTVINHYYGLNVFNILGIAFIVLKLMNYIDWSWWYVIAPFFVIPMIYLSIAVLMIFILIVTSIFVWIIEFKEKRNKKYKGI